MSMSRQNGKDSTRKHKTARNIQTLAAVKVEQERFQLHTESRLREVAISSQRLRCRRRIKFTRIAGELGSVIIRRTAKSRRSPSTP